MKPLHQFEQFLALPQLTWLPKIRDRALFDASGYVSAIEPLKLCEQDFQQFSQQVYDAQELFETPPGTTSELGIY
ncbi:hypothetical protein [Microcoleus vaginatus]|uniref:hypothetical protein n=1 Tax=Microcoleus vaginatus TaxID=119532 RepID=UPI0032AE31D9